MEGGLGGGESEEKRNNRFRYKQFTPSNENIVHPLEIGFFWFPLRVLQL